MPETKYSASSEKPRGRLYLIPAPLGETGLISDVIPELNQIIIQGLNLFIVEELRTARRYLKRINKSINIDALEFMIFNEHTVKEDIHQYIEPLLDGRSAGILSEAGLPCLADPGSEIVAEAHRNHIEVIPLTGPSSLFLALMASGFNGQNFAFHGYLPVDKLQRSKKLRQLENLSRQNTQTQIFIETPYRNQQMIQAILENCSSETMLCVAADLTLPTQKIISRPVKFWQKNIFDFQKRPAVFLLYAR